MPFCSILLIFNLPHNEYTHPILDIDVHNNNQVQECQYKKDKRKS